MKPSVRITYLILLEYTKRHWNLFLASFVIILLTAFLQLRFGVLDFNLNTVSEGFVGTFQEHDLPTEVTRLVSSGLVETDPSGRMTPKIADSWEVNKDATVYKFRLRSGLKWTSGAAIKSSDMDFAIPNTEVSFPDDKTIEFKLKESYAAFPSLLTKPIFKRDTLMGVGPYKISKIEKSRIFITKVILDPTVDNMPQILVRFYPNEKTAMTGFSLGEVQSLWGVSSRNLEANSLGLYTRVDYTKIVTIFYNMKDNVVGGSNRSLRQALSFSAPSIESEVEANNPYPPSSWAFNGAVKNYLGNLDEAKSALERAKSSGGKDILEKEIVLTTTPQLEDIGKKVVAAWRGLGVNALLRVESGIPQNFQALLITQSIPTDPDQYFLWHETQKETNLTRYDQKRVDKDLEDGRKLLDEEDRKEKYLDFQKVLLEDSPATFLYFPKYNILFLKKAESKLEKIMPLQFNQLIRKS